MLGVAWYGMRAGSFTDDHWWPHPPESSRLKHSAVANADPVVHSAGIVRPTWSEQIPIRRQRVRRWQLGPFGMHTRQVCPCGHHSEEWVVALLWWWGRRYESRRGGIVGHASTGIASRHRHADATGSHHHRRLAGNAGLWQLAEAA